MFKKIFIKLCAQKNVAPTKVCVDIGLSNAAFTGWNENTVPRQTTLQKIADYFGVSVDYLLGKEPEPLTPAPSALDEELAGLWAELSEDQRREAFNYIQYLKTKRPPEGDPKG